MVSGLVPLAVLALGVALYLRARPGLRALIALMLAFFAFLAASEAVYYTREVGASGDDYTGLLAIQAGVLLLVVGVVTLWRSRKRDDRLARRYLRRLLLAGGALSLRWFGRLP